MTVLTCKYTIFVLALCLAIDRLNLTNADESASPSKCERDCPTGYVLLEQNCLCYPDEKQPCPEGSIFLNKKCRKIVCPLGEFYRGICLQAICPVGLVWRGKKCQEPGYLTTVLEIENVLINEKRENAIYVEKSVNNEFVHHTTTENPRSVAPTTKSTPTATTTPPTDHPPSSIVNQTGCCMVRTPRICKRYGQKWICFNRSNKLCDSRVCTAPIVYLRAPEIKYTHPMLIMPPNPPHLDNCPNGDCPDQNIDGVVDCSGCASNLPENCSPYCYKYMCPTNSCTFMNLDLYCSYYPGQFGCIIEDGCLWNWC